MTDALEEFLGSPLLASKVEDSYDVVAQLLGEMCDAGIIAATEPNALRDVVEAPSWMGKLLSGVALPGCVYIFSILQSVYQVKIYDALHLLIQTQKVVPSFR